MRNLAYSSNYRSSGLWKPVSENLINNKQAKASSQREKLLFSVAWSIGNVRRTLCEDPSRGRERKTGLRMRYKCSLRRQMTAEWSDEQRTTKCIVPTITALSGTGHRIADRRTRALLLFVTAPSTLTALMERYVKDCRADDQHLQGPVTTSAVPFERLLKFAFLRRPPEPFGKYSRKVSILFQLKSRLCYKNIATSPGWARNVTILCDAVEQRET